MARRVFLQELYDPVEKGQGTPSLDLVLVHGIDGDPVKTWQDGESGTLWPCDLLPQLLPRTRVLSFGYNADMYRNNSVAGIRDNARSLLTYLMIERQTANLKRPIVFVAHCLGGLIVKQALYFAEFDGEFTDTNIKSETKLIVFFGTPHQGTDKDKWDQIAKAYSPLDKFRGKRSPLVETMRRDSEALADVNEKFRQLAEEYDITSFYERRPWRNTSACIVNATDAQMVIEQEKPKPVDADHVAMCWFSSANNPDFRALCKDIEAATGIHVADSPGTVSPMTTVVASDDGEEKQTWVASPQKHSRTVIQGKIRVTEISVDCAVEKQQPGTDSEAVLPPVEREQDAAAEGGRGGGLLDWLWNKPWHGTAGTTRQGAFFGGGVFGASGSWM